MVVLCRHWPEEEFAMADPYVEGSLMDLVSGAEVPKVKVTDQDRAAFFAAADRILLECNVEPAVMIAVGKHLIPEIAFARAEVKREMSGPEIEVSPEAIRAGQLAIADRVGLIGSEIEIIYRAIRRVELSQKEPTS